MSKELKKLIVNELVSDYKGVDNFIVMNYKGVDALQANALRKDLSDKDIKMKVVKNSLASIAFKEIGNPELGELLNGPSAVATSGNDPVVFAKTLMKWSQEMSEFKAIGGLVEGKVSLPADIKTLATIPSKQVLLTQVLLGISTPLIQLSNLFNAEIRNIYLVLLAVKEKKEEVE